MKKYNFIEAVNSGKRFRTKGSATWLGKCTKFSNITLTLELINAEFEVEEKTITITESEFNLAWEKLIGWNDVDYTSKSDGFKIILDKAVFKKELGF